MLRSVSVTLQPAMCSIGNCCYRSDQGSRVAAEDCRLVELAIEDCSLSCECLIFFPAI